MNWWLGVMGVFLTFLPCLVSSMRSSQISQEEQVRDDRYRYLKAQEGRTP